MYLREDAVEAAEDRPEPPERPSAGFSLPAVRGLLPPKFDVRPTWGWRVDEDGRTAVLHVDRILQGDLPRPFGPTLLLVPAAGAIVRPVGLHWSLTGANPAYRRIGTLTVMPETQVGEG